jgi:low-affinity ferrous iron transport protein
VHGTHPAGAAAKAELDDQGAVASVAVDEVNEYTKVAKTRILDRWLDKAVEFSGSQFVFFVIVVALLVWALLGIRFGHSNDWQVVISDVQAVVNMVFDAFLMRQQLNSHDSIMFVTACLRSRITSNKRMLKSLMASWKYELIRPSQFEELEQSEFVADLPRRTGLGGFPQLRLILSGISYLSVSSGWASSSGLDSGTTAAGPTLAALH